MGVASLWQPAFQRDLAKICTYETHNGPIVEELMENILGRGFLLSSMHGVLVEQFAGGQSMHQDMSFPLPHPPFPTQANIIYMYTPWSLENGGTYVIPGSATDGHGNNILTRTRTRMTFCRNKYGIVALCGVQAPALSAMAACFMRAPSTAPGMRLGNNIYHCRNEARRCV